MDERSISEDRGDSPEETFRPYRQLAVRVLALALRDMVNPDGSAADRNSAREFLKGSGMLRHWCRVAALDPNCLVKVAEKLGADSLPSRVRPL